MKKNTGLFKKGDGRAVKAGSKGGKSTAKKVGTKGMSERGRKGAEKRWDIPVIKEGEVKSLEV